MDKFEAGKTYATRSLCDHDCIVRVTVVRRTAKTIVTDKGKTLRVFIDYNGHEAVKPWGSYSMCPIVSADDVTAAPQPVVVAEVAL